MKKIVFKYREMAFGSQGRVRSIKVIFVLLFKYFSDLYQKKPSTETSLSLLYSSIDLSLV